MNTFRFESPWLLLLLLPVLLVWLLVRRRRRPAVLYSSTVLMAQLPRTFAQRVRNLLPWVWLLGLCLVVLALARPQLGREQTRIRAEGIAIEMCVDKSGSMQAMDFELAGQQVNRLAVVKDVFRSFVAGEDDFVGRPDDMIGLISFGGFATAVCPLTLDHGALLEVLQTVEIPAPILDDEGRVLNRSTLQEESATAIGDALALAVARLKESTAKSRVVVLLSDGSNTAGVVSPEEAAETAREFGIRVYCIGIGSSGVAPFPMQDFAGRTVLQPQLVEFDESNLHRIAETTDGKYFNARNTEALRDVYAEIDQLEKTELDGRLYTDYRETFPWPLWAGVSCLMLVTILQSTRMRGLP